MSETPTHRYEATCAWRGSTGAGYRSYDRTHTGAAPPARTALTLSSDATFLGDVDLLNPEQLVVLAASSCQLLSFLAVAARARIDIVAYEDHAEGLMPEGDPPTRITEIHLRPRITVRGPATEARVRALVDTAHRECFVANSLTTHIDIIPTIDLLAGDQPNHDARAASGATTRDA